MDSLEGTGRCTWLVSILLRSRNVQSQTITDEGERFKTISCQEETCLPLEWTSLQSSSEDSIHHF